METILRKDKRRELPTSWELTRIGNVVDTHGGSTPSTAKPEYWDDGGILWATPTDITSLNTKYISDTERKISQKAADETSLRLCEPGTLLMTSRATIGYPAIAEKPITTNQGFINIHCGNKVETLFLYYWIAQNRALLERFAQGSTFLELPKKDFRRFHIDLPPLSEQRKIAEILSTVDETIEKTDAIIQETQQLKKGLMQKLFTKGIGHTRFKETKIGRIEYGTIPVDWDEVELNSICNVTSSKRIMMHEYVDLGIPFYRSKEIIEKMRGISHDKILYISESRFQEISRKFGAPQNGDILITAVGSLGVPYLIEYDERFYFKDGNLLWLRDFSGEIDKRFLIYYFESFGFKKVIEVITAGSSQKALTIEKLEKLRIPLPNSSEQKMITQILSEVDAKIEKEQDFKSELKQLKTGLMQVLLTGKARMKV